MPKHRRPKRDKAAVASVMAAFAKLEQPTSRQHDEQTWTLAQGSCLRIPDGTVFSAFHVLDTKKLDTVVPGFREKYGIFARAMAGTFIGVVALEDVRIEVLSEVDVARVVKTTRMSAQQLYARTIGSFSGASYEEFEAETTIRRHAPQEKRKRLHVGFSAISDLVTYEQGVACRAVAHRSSYHVYAKVANFEGMQPYDVWMPVQHAIDTMLPPGTMLPFNGLQIKLCNDQSP